MWLSVSVCHWAKTVEAASSSATWREALSQYKVNICPNTKAKTLRRSVVVQLFFGLYSHSSLEFYVKSTLLLSLCTFLWHSLHFSKSKSFTLQCEQQPSVLLLGQWCWTCAGLLRVKVIRRKRRRRLFYLWDWADFIFHFHTLAFWATLHRSECSFSPRLLVQ